MTRPRHLVAVVGVAGLALGSLACSSDDDGSSSATPSATCTDLQRVQDDVDALVDTDVLQDGTDALEENLDQLRDSVSDLADSASGDVEAESDDLRSSVDQLSSIIDGAGDQPVTSTLGQAADQLRTISSDLGSLLAAARDELSGCDTSTTTGGS